MNAAEHDGQGSPPKSAVEFLQQCDKGHIEDIAVWHKAAAAMKDIVYNKHYPESGHSG